MRKIKSDPQLDSLWQQFAEKNGCSTPREILDKLYNDNGKSIKAVAASINFKETHVYKAFRLYYPDFERTVTWSMRAKEHGVATPAELFIKVIQDDGITDSDELLKLFNVTRNNLRQALLRFTPELRHYAYAKPTPGRGGAPKNKQKALTAAKKTYRICRKCGNKIRGSNYYFCISCWNIVNRDPPAEEIYAMPRVRML